MYKVYTERVQELAVKELSKLLSKKVSLPHKKYLSKFGTILSAEQIQLGVSWMVSMSTQWQLPSGHSSGNSPLL